MDVYGCYEENDESRIVMQPAEILFVLEAVHDVLRLMILQSDVRTTLRKRRLEKDGFSWPKARIEVILRSCLVPGLNNGLIGSSFPGKKAFTANIKVYVYMFIHTCISL